MGAIKTGAEIAAAHQRKRDAGPELYEALERLVNFLSQPRVILMGKTVVLGEAREALAKARGDQS